MVFYYHLYGQAVETLRVKVGDQVLWEISGNQGNNWYKATVPLNYLGIYRVSNYRESYDVILCFETSHLLSGQVQKISCLEGERKPGKL